MILFILQSPRLDPTGDELEEQLIQFLKKQTEPLKVSVIAGELKLSNVKKVTSALYSLRKVNILKSGKEGRALTWAINWNVMQRDDTEECAEEDQNTGPDPLETEGEYHL